MRIPRLRDIQKILDCFSSNTAKELGKKSIMSPKKDWVTETINSNTVVIFSKTYCPYCKMAKEAFEKLKQPFEAIELENRDDGDEIQDILGELTGARSVPRVFVKGQFIGGGTDVKKLYESGELAKQLA
uniref:Glutaredoxin-2, mitochondrial n=3 Tax=Braconinae TaxID=65225 RepID=A0A455LAS6_9HYME|nr:glutaredoxin-C4-like protein [Habrobracon hebetor]